MVTVAVFSDILAYVVKNVGFSIWLNKETLNLDFKDRGCKAGEMLACQNGICQKNGFCKCSLDYTGLTCSTCKWI